MAEENPILNNPYEEPGWHYATNLEGELDYERPTWANLTTTRRNKHNAKAALRWGQKHYGGQIFSHGEKKLLKVTGNEGAT